MLDATAPHALPAVAGIGYKSQHFSGLMAAPGPVGWLEIHAENYMGAGGRPLAQLRALAERFPISVHGVGLSIGGERPLDTEHLARLRHLCDWLNPASFSEHLAWSTHDTGFLNDLLPLPYTQATLARICTHIDQLQEVLGRRMLLENPSTYLAFADSEMAEVDFRPRSRGAPAAGCFSTSTMSSFRPPTRAGTHAPISMPSRSLPWARSIWADMTKMPMTTAARC